MDIPVAADNRHLAGAAPTPPCAYGREERDGDVGLFRGSGCFHAVQKISPEGKGAADSLSCAVLKEKPWASVVGTGHRVFVRRRTATGHGPHRIRWSSPRRIPDRICVSRPATH